MSVFKFPENFKWGSATSAHQIEGDNHNDWSEWERSEARVKSLKFKGLNPDNFISGRACDSYNRYEEDFDIAKKLNQNIYRFSIEWSRIEPEEGKFNDKEIQHYIQVVKSLRDRGIEPMITLWHFTNPTWFSEKGGWLNSESPELFRRFIKVVVSALKGENVKLWITFNESATVYAGFSYLTGQWSSPQHTSIFKFMRVRRHFAKAHILAYKEIKKIYQDFSPINLNNTNKLNLDAKNTQLQEASHNVEVGLVDNMTYVIHGDRWYEKLIGKIYNYRRNLVFWDETFPYYDFMGLNYYHLDRRVPGSYRILPKQDWMNETDWEIYPKGVYHCLTELKRFKKPVYITENGIADSADQKRDKFIKDHLYWIWKALQDGVKVRGYLYWSLLDNFEWDHGYVPKFGLVEVDYKTFERHIRPSAYEYAKICLTNQLEVD